MTTIYVLLIISLYLGVGLCAARVWNERVWRTQGIGQKEQGRKRTASEELDARLGVGFAITIFWPLLAIVVCIGLIIANAIRILEHLYVPAELREKVR